MQPLESGTKLSSFSVTTPPLAIKDFYFWMRRYKHIPKQSKLIVYTGLFGQGKTLSMVHDVIVFYNTYNNKIVYDDRFNEFVKQKVLVISNVNELLK